MFESQKVYHIYNRANGRENLFIEEKNFHFFLEKYFRHISPVAETYAFCLMPNHFHIMIKIKHEDEVISDLGTDTVKRFGTFGKLVSKQFSNLFSSYTQALNKSYCRTGSLFQPNLKKKEVTSDAYFTKLILYIHNNPVKHGFVQTPYDWQFSSIHQLTSTEACGLKQKEVIDWFGDINQFKKSHTNIGIIESVFD